MNEKICCEKCSANFEELDDVQRSATLGVLDRIVLECRRCKHRMDIQGEEARRVDAMFRPAVAETKTKPAAPTNKAAAEKKGS